MNNPAAQLESARQHHEAGRLDQARKIYEQILQTHPNHPDAQHLLGFATFLLGDAEAGLRQIDHAIELDPRRPLYHYNRGVILAAIKRNDTAAEAFRQALNLNPKFAEAWLNLGLSLHQLQQWTQAEQAFTQALSLRPNWPEAHMNLGNVYFDQGRFTDSIACYERALTQRPRFAEAYYALGNTHRRTGDLRKATDLYQHAIAIQPNYPEAFNRLGTLLAEVNELGTARAALEQAICQRPDFAEAIYNLAGVVKDSGETAKAVALFRRAVNLRPDVLDYQNGLIYALHFQSIDGKEIWPEIAEWNRRHAEPLRKHIVPHGNSPEPERRLKIGYLSPDFAAHPVARFLLPLFSQHDRSQVEIICYADVLRPDAITDQCRAQSDAWRDVLRMPDADVAEMIRADGIDILLELALHLNGSRLPLFAQKPAPIQITYLSYCSTSGMREIDYRFTDPYLDPPEIPTPYGEESYYLRSYWCYQPHFEDVPTAESPAASAGHITFGCLNNYSKVTHPTWDLWIELLRQVPTSRLLVYSPLGDHRDVAFNRLKAAGVDPARLQFTRFAEVRKYFEQYNQIDIALDPFPYAGGTTSCDALWMGVPVVTLRGQTAVGRAGVSVLSQLNLPELIADNPDQYVRIAKSLADDLPRLAEMRRTMRTRMRQSPLMDAKGFAHDVERAYRTMWRKWCESNRGNPR